jgi:hypothetical protein
MNATTVKQLRELASGDCYAAFRSAALACGMTAQEADLVWRADGQPVGEEIVADVRESGMEIRGAGDAWLTSSVAVELEGSR